MGLNGGTQWVVSFRLAASLVQLMEPQQQVLGELETVKVR